VVSAVRDLILGHLPDGNVEAMNWGMISYEVPLERCADTYNGEPLMYVGLAAQKHHYAVYLQGVYATDEIEARLRAAYERAGKRLDLGKSCLRFRKLDDLVVDAVGDAVAATDVDTFVALARAARKR
jgi:hypothetical protein